jgi:hypothetical protein
MPTWSHNSFKPIKMLEYDSRSLTSGAASLLVVTLLTLPALVAVRSHVCEPKSKPALYEDKDGVASEKSMAEYTAKYPKILLLIFTLLGFATAVSLAVLGTLDRDLDPMFLENWLSAAQWVCPQHPATTAQIVNRAQFLILVQTLGIGLIRKTTKTYTLGIFVAVSCTLLLLTLLYHDGLLARDPLVKGLGSPEAVALRSSQLVLAVAAGFTGLSIPRRPVVFKDGVPIDGMYTASALGRYTFSWASSLLALARERKRLNPEDLPKMDYHTRSRDLSQSWAETKHPRKLWIEIFLAHREPLMIQWFLTLLQAFGNFAPHFVIFHLLRILETRVLGQEVSPEAWIWVVVLTITTLGASWVEAWLFWISWSEIAIPVRSQLAALIFQKAMRRKDVKGASKKETGDGPDIVPPVTGDSAAADKEDAEEEGDPKGKQSTVNLIGVDTKRVSDFCSFNNYFPGSLFKLTVSVCFLLGIIGWKALLAGFCAFSITIPLNIFFSRRYAAAQDRLMKVRDSKMGVVTEALQGKSTNYLCVNKCH